LGQPEKLHFKTSSGIKNIVGKDLITDRFVAVFELVKNAYDAKATKVIVSFDLDLSDLSQKIIIRDNGIGMNRDDLINKWLYLAYSDKKEGQSNDGRAFVGQKGIGRFSCDSLGVNLLIRTKKVDDITEHQLIVNWKDFEETLEKRFESIDVVYTSTSVEDVKFKNSYTILEIKGLRHEWDNSSIKKVKESLRRLKNPFNSSDGFDIYCGEEILSSYRTYDEIPEKFIIKSNITEVIKGKCVTIETTINNNIKIELFDRGKHIYRVQKKNDSPLKDAEIFIAVNYLTTSAKMTFTRRMGVAPRNYGNVFVYRNDFRVSPYGDEFADLFGLNVRKTQGYSRYIGTREIIGHIDIKDTKDMFRETSSRNNGFIENIYYDALKSAYMDYAHKPLEKYVNLIQWGEDNTNNQEINLHTIDRTEAERFKNSLAGNNTDEFQLQYFADDLNFEENNPKKQLEKLTLNLTGDQQELLNNAIKKFGDLEQENKEKQTALLEKQKTIAALAVQNQNLLSKRPESSYGQQLTHHFPKVIRRLNTSISDLNQLPGLTSTQKTALYKVIKKIKRTSTELSSIKYLLLKTNLDFRSASNINWYNFVNGFAKEKSPKSNENLMKVLCVAEDEESKSAWSIHCNALDLMMMLENFYNNAEEHSATYMQFNFKNTQIEITSNSEPITHDNLERIFELGFSTKENGTGIGLDQIRTFLKDKCNLKIKAINLQNEVNFQIYK
jgi:hypothetical protein